MTVIVFCIPPRTTTGTREKKSSITCWYNEESHQSSSFTGEVTMDFWHTNLPRTTHEYAGLSVCWKSDMLSYMAQCPHYLHVYNSSLLILCRYLHNGLLLLLKNCHIKICISKVMALSIVVGIKSCWEATILMLEIMGGQYSLMPNWLPPKWGTSSIFIQVHYQSLAKEHPPLKERPPPSFGPIFCIRLLFAQMSALPRASYTWLIECMRGVWESHPQALCTSEVKNFKLYFAEGFYKWQMYSYSY